MMLTEEQLQAIKAPFPPQAVSADTSRGFELTSIKAAYVIERLNEVFGTCGVGWRYAHSPFDELVNDKGQVEVITEVALQYRCQEEDGCPPVVWVGGWAFPDNGAIRQWSEPVVACGGHAVGRGGAPNTDARKSAVTDGITKAASMIGIGHEVFKGLVRVGVQLQARNMPAGGNGDGANATTFWELYHQQAKNAGIPIKVAKGLAQNADWAKACQGLKALIAGSIS